MAGGRRVVEAGGVRVRLEEGLIATRLGAGGRFADEWRYK